MLVLWPWGLSGQISSTLLVFRVLLGYCILGIKIHEDDCENISRVVCNEIYKVVNTVVRILINCIILSDTVSLSRNIFSILLLTMIKSYVSLFCLPLLLVSEKMQARKQTRRVENLATLQVIRMNWRSLSGRAITYEAKPVHDRLQQIVSLFFSYRSLINRP